MLWHVCATLPTQCFILLGRPSPPRQPLALMELRSRAEFLVVDLVGDVDQLPSVGPGQVLADIIASDVVRGGAHDPAPPFSSACIKGMSIIEVSSTT